MPPSPLDLEDVPAGPPSGTLLARLDDLPHHGGKELVFRDGHMVLRLLVQRHGAGAVVYENRCPHAGTPLNMFDDKFIDITGGRLLCRTHGALFDIASGRCVRGPCKGDHLRAVNIDIRDDAIYSA
ncbi:Rieske (2Fe-2S) protein [Kordiimonas aestuarii]|uniref:Rieske (2Fe-2S) protein n=1 Tax=Kordiimonas aestuarii TaxID=1005925 RepID=UPI0021D07AF5|nr:Rieske (2Fe-2S) protein [Kordiimonas aestuarii]